MPVPLRYVVVLYRCNKLYLEERRLNMAKYVLALDQGTTSSRAIVFDHAGSVVSLAQQEFPQIYPSPGLVEHDPEAIWSSQLAVAQEAMKKAGASVSDIAAIGITNQREKAASGDVLFGNVDTFLMWRLSRGRVHATDPSNASRTLMYNIYKGDWDDVILNELGVPRAMLPTVMPSSGVFGETDPEFFGGAIKMAGDAGDQQAATFGQACYEVGMSKNN